MIRFNIFFCFLFILISTSPKTLIVQSFNYNKEKRRTYDWYTL